ncbi:hypothetical protein K2173_001644 [Erythroxylum novogranatense]|uniref:DYW domain-containing protein n=1 Tax=Erythroxylum novogranatense TaxID=1862640 RepID=A0AAV8S5K4_9ROSI|nr:hypothetical protein K2173_001644 [Erythroxylum novogranatense]
MLWHLVRKEVACAKCLYFAATTFPCKLGSWAASSTTGGDLETSESSSSGAERFLIRRKNILCKSFDGSGTGLHVLDLIDRGCLLPSRSIYHSLLIRCAHLRKLEEGRIVHAHVVNSEFKHDVYMMNTVVNMYAKCGSLEDARVVFEEMPERDVVSWTALIMGYSQHGQSKKAIFLLPEMLRSGVQPNHFTLSIILKASGTGACKSKSHGWQLHAFSLKMGHHADVFVGTALLDMYARCGQVEEARVVFDGLVSKNEVSWNALIAAHVRKGEGEHAFRLLHNMLRENIEPTEFTYSSVFRALASIGSLEQGKWVHARMIKSDTQLIAFVGNTLLDMYANFDSLVKRDVVSWNSMLSGFAQHGLGEMVLKRFEQMLRMGIRPNGITFLCVLTACSHSGLLDEGLFYFDEMKKYRLEPEIYHYVAIVDLLGRAGLLDQADKFIRQMPMEPTAAVWGALLGACRMYKNEKLGAYAAERIFEIDPRDSGPHMLLYNIYATAGRWNNAAKVRKMMKESRVKKEPACSWVEIENQVHTFVADDHAHPMREEIHKMWETISEKIKGIGYTPDTSHVLLFVDQQEREIKLQYHSEKLALAFALLSTPPASTIRIKKNIRICGDCHTAFKFVSNVLGREIVVRDINRFHHFHNGLCSCGDYW